MQKELSWEAMEYTQKIHTVDWYWTVGLVTLAIVAACIFFGNFLRQRGSQDTSAGMIHGRLSLFFCRSSSVGPSELIKASQATRKRCQCSSFQFVTDLSTSNSFQYASSAAA